MANVDGGLMSTILDGRFPADRRGMISELVRRLMDRRGPQLAQVVEDRLGRAGPAPDVFDTWRTGLGGAPPGEVLIELLKLAHEDPDLVSLVDALIGRRTDSQLEAPIREMADSPSSAILARASDAYGKLTDVERRRFLQLLMGTAVGGSIHIGSPHLDLVRHGLDDAILGGEAQPAIVADWEETVHAHGRATRERPSPLMLADLTHDLTDLKRTLDSNQSRGRARDLTRVAAEMAGLMCLTLVKLDDRVTFRQWARTARIAAAQAGDPLVHSWVRAQEAYGFYYAGNLQRAVDVARDAQRLAGSTPCVGAVLAAALEARAQAAIGRSAQTISAIENAERILSQLDPRYLMPSAFGYSEAQLRFHESNALTQLGDTQRAWFAQERALALIPDYDYTDRALTHLDRATCMVNSKDVLGAAEYAVLALGGLTAEQRRGIITVRAGDIISSLPTAVQQLPAGRNLSEIVMSTEGDA